MKNVEGRLRALGFLRLYVFAAHSAARVRPAQPSPRCGRGRENSDGGSAENEAIKHNEADDETSQGDGNAHDGPPCEHGPCTLCCGFWSSQIVSNVIADFWRWLSFRDRDGAARTGRCLRPEARIISQCLCMGWASSIQPWKDRSNGCEAVG